MTGSSARRRSSSGRAWLPVGLAVAVLASLVAVGSVSQGSGSAEAAERVMPRSGASDDTLGYWTPMGIRVRTGDDSFQDPGLNQAVYALVKYDDKIIAGGLFDDTGGGGNNEANCSDDAEYALQCIAQWDPVTNAWTAVGGGLNNQVDAFLVKDDTLYVGGDFDDTVGGPGFARCNPSAGIAWTPRAAASDDSWSSVTWGGAPDNRFVAVASAGDDTRVMTSTDGVNWTSDTPAPRSPWSSVTWGNGMFVAVASAGDDTRVMTSTNGVNWSRPSTSVRQNAWQSVVWGGGTDNRFVAVASNSDDSQVMTSLDGITWIPRRAASDDSWTSVTWGNGLFVAVASNGDDTPVMTSPDGETWTRPATRVPVNEWQSVTWGNGKFVAVSSSEDDTQVMTSENGIVWRSRAGSFYDDSWASVTWGGDMFVAVASSGTRKQVMYARDGVTWSTRTSGTVPNQWRSVAWSDAGTGDAVDDTIVVVGARGPKSQQVMTSVATPSPGALRCIAAWNENRSAWTPVGGGLNGGVTALASLGDDTLLVGGAFESSDPESVPYPGLSGLATWTEGVWTHPGVGGFSADVRALLALGPLTAYVGGTFRGDSPEYDDSGIMGMSGPYEDSSSWFPMNTGFSWINPAGTPPETPGSVSALALIDDTIYAGGNFSATGDRSRTLANLASWNGTTWNTVGDGLNADIAEPSRRTSVRALASDDTRGLLYVGGTFDDTAGGFGNGLCDDTNIAVGPLRCVTVWDTGINEFLPFKWGSEDDSNGLTGEVHAIVVDDSVVYVGGQFNTWPEGGFPKAWNLKNVGKWTWGAPSASLATSSGDVGATLAITGSRLIGVSEVKFGTTPAAFTRSSITSMAATVPNLAPGTYTVTVNAVGGIATAGTYTVSSINPPTPTRPSAPLSVSAVAGDRSATVSWLPPSSQGYYPVTDYRVTSSVGSRTCLVTATTCEITGLANGRSYTFTVEALSGAGWSHPSAPSNPVTPAAKPPLSITIVGTRQGRGVVVSGSTTGFGMGGMVTAHTRTSRDVPYIEGATALVSMDGDFEWSRGVNRKKTLWVYFTGGTAKSNTLRLAPRA